MREEDVQKITWWCHYGNFMPFSFTNAPATFNSGMNKMFNKQLRNFVLIFFDDILIYSRTSEEHLHHLNVVLIILEDQYLFSKLSKCNFGMTKILYLCYVIGQEGVKVHMENILSILDWQSPKNLTDLRGSLDCAITIGSLWKDSTNWHLLL